MHYLYMHTILCYVLSGSSLILPHYQTCDKRGCIIFKPGGSNVNSAMFILASSFVIMFNPNYWGGWVFKHNQYRDICVNDVLSRQCTCYFVIFHVRFMEPLPATISNSRLIFTNTQTSRLFQFQIIVHKIK